MPIIWCVITTFVDAIFPYNYYSSVTILECSGVRFPRIRVLGVEHTNNIFFFEDTDKEQEKMKGVGYTSDFTSQAGAPNYKSKFLKK